MGAPSNAVGSLTLPVRPGQHLTMTIVFGYRPKTEEGSTAADKAAVLSADWVDGEGNPIDNHKPSGWAKSDTYGLFRYVACPNDRDETHCEIVVTVPSKAASVRFTVHRFSNWTVNINQITLRRS
ncbi:MAG: hypothetical protein M9932_17660 [Xanthobacteraceae bacterium]|nr:hypothetical protein [Xanthobacteraceae bacterium]